MDMFGFEPLAAGQFKKLAQHALTGLCRCGIPNDSEMVSAVCDFDVESSFDVPQVLIELTAEVGEPGVVLRLKNQISADQ